MLDDFSKVSGLKLNDRKTEALWIGSRIGNDEMILPGREFKWPISKVKTLGLWLSTNSEESALLNYNEKIEKIRKILSCWKYRRLTLLGKITVLKSLAASQLVYLLSPLQSDSNAINEIDKLFYQFLWNGRGDKIKWKVMINDYGDGGLKLIDLISFTKSLKAAWVKKCLGTTYKRKWKFFFDLHLQNCGPENMFSCNLNVTDTDILETVKVTDPFLKEILEIWAEVNCEHHITSGVQFQEQNLWFNSLITIGNKPVLFKGWLAKGITKAKQLQKLDSSNYLSLNEFRSKYSLNARPLSLYGMISAVKLLGQSKTTAAGGTTKFEPFSTKLLNTKKVSSLGYKKLVKKEGLNPNQQPKEMA